MKRLLLIFFLIMPGLAWAQNINVVTIHSEINPSIGFWSGNGTARMQMASDGTIYIQYGEEPANKERYAYSTDDGATWSYSDSISGSELYARATAQFNCSVILQDTLYVFWCSNESQIYIHKIYQGTEYNQGVWIDSCSSCSGVSMNYTGISGTPFVYVGDTTSTNKAFYRTSDRIVVGMSVTQGGTFGVGSSANVMATPAANGVIIIQTTGAAADLWFLDTDNTVTGSTNFLGNNLILNDVTVNCSMVARSKTDSSFYVVYARDDATGLVLLRGHINSSSQAYVFDDSIGWSVSAPTNAGTALYLRNPAISIRSNGDIYIYYKEWADTTDFDNHAIKYVVSTDQANSVGAATIVRAATGSDSIYYLTAPPYLADQSPEITACSYRRGPGAASGATIEMFSDTLGGGEPPAYDVPDFIQGPAGGGFIQSKSGSAYIQKK